LRLSDKILQLEYFEYQLFGTTFEYPIAKMHVNPIQNDDTRYLQHPATPPLPCVRVRRAFHVFLHVFPGALVDVGQPRNLHGGAILMGGQRMGFVNYPIRIRSMDQV
jgi:hypothetical protein